MKNYESEYLEYAHKAARAILGRHVLMVFGGTIIYSDQPPEPLQEAKSAEREAETDLLMLIS